MNKIVSEKWVLYMYFFERKRGIVYNIFVYLNECGVWLIVISIKSNLLKFFIIL